MKTIRALQSCANSQWSLQIGQEAALLNADADALIKAGLAELVEDHGEDPEALKELARSSEAAKKRNTTAKKKSIKQQR